MGSEAGPDNGRRVLRLRYAAVCSVCGADLPAGTRATWDRVERAATCESCAPIAAPSEAAAGASADREHRRRQEARARRVRQRHPRIGGLLLALTDEPQSTRAWARGAEGERRVAARLDSLDPHGVVSLHDRRIPGTRANIDHVCIAAPGVFVVDTKRYRGKLEVRRPWFGLGQATLRVGGRDRTKLVEGLSRQTDAVHDALADLADPIPVVPVLCFVDVELGLLAKPERVDDVEIHWPRSLAKRLRGRGPLDARAVRAVADHLSRTLRPA